MHARGAWIRRRRASARVLGPQHVVVCANPQDGDSAAIADYYMQVRGIPAKNRLNHTPVFTSNTYANEWQVDDLKAFLSKLVAMIDADPELEAVVLCGWWPTVIRRDATIWTGDTITVTLPVDSTAKLPAVLLQALDVNASVLDVDDLCSALPPVVDHAGVVYPTLQYKPGFNYDIDVYGSVYPIGAAGAPPGYALHDAPPDLDLRQWSPRRGEVVYTNIFYRDAGGNRQYRLYSTVAAGEVDHVLVDGRAAKLESPVRRPVRTGVTQAGVSAVIRKSYEATRRARDTYSAVRPGARQEMRDRYGSGVLPVRFYRLTAPKPASADPVWGGQSVFDVVKARIDAMIAAEQQGWTKIPGGAVTYGGTYDVGQYAFYLLSMGYGADPVLVQGMNGRDYYAEVGLRVTDVQAPNALWADNTGVFPQYGAPWTTPPAMFLGLTSSKSYFGDYGAPGFALPWDYSHFNFVDGALFCMSQSCGSQLIDGRAFDWYYSTINLPAANNVGRKTADGTGGLLFTAPDSPAGRQHIAFRFKYSGAASLAEYEVTADNQITLYEDGASTAVLAIPTTSFNDAAEYVRLNAPSGWTLNIGCPGVRSRAADFILRGGCCTWGAAMEPFASRNPSFNGEMLETLMSGASFHDAMLHYSSYGRVQPYGNAAYLIVHGDPLYTPFRARRS